jgi:hypothetical protein
MAKKRYRPEEIIGKLRQADVLMACTLSDSSMGHKTMDNIEVLHARKLPPILGIRQW